MKRLHPHLITLFLLYSSLLFSQNSNNLQLPTSVNTDGEAPDPSAILDVQAIDKGILVPRLTSSQRTAIATPATGLLVFDNDDNTFYFHNGNEWHRLGVPSDGQLGEIIATDSTGQVLWQPLFDPAMLNLDPNQVFYSSLSINTNPVSIAVQKSYAYVVDAGSLKIIDVSDPLNLSLIGNQSISSSTPEAVVVQDSCAYVLDSGSGELVVINVSDPGNPMIDGNLPIGSNPESLVVKGSYVYIVDSGSEDLKIINVSDPLNPTLTGSLTIGSGLISVGVEGNHAYVLDDNSDELKVIDVSDPETPELTGSRFISGDFVDLRFLEVLGDFVYVIDDGSNDLIVIDVSNPENPLITNRKDAGLDPEFITIQDNFAYVLDLGGQLRVFDVSDPGNPAPVPYNLLDFGTDTRSVAVQGNYAYVVSSTASELIVIQLGGRILGLSQNGQLVPAVESDPKVAIEAKNWLPKWDGDALVRSQAIFEDASGRVGLGTTIPGSNLEIRTSTSEYGASGGLRITRSNDEHWNINTFSDVHNDLGFFYNGLSRGWLDAASNVDQLDFTAQHRSLPSNGNVQSYKDKIGMIVSSDGNIYNLDGSNMPTVNESIPTVQLSEGAKDNRIYGVIAGIEEPEKGSNPSQRKYLLGAFGTSIDRVDENDYRLIINSGGEGGIWVSNYNGTIKNGDLITTSPLPGIGMKQDDDLIHSYTVAKVVMDCDFNLDSDKYESKEVTYNGKSYRMAFLACVYKCN